MTDKKKKDFIIGETRSGFSFEIAKTRFDNFELLEILGELDENPLLLPKVTKMILGDEEKKRLYDHVRRDDGTVPTEAIGDELADIFDSVREVKN